MQITVKDLKQNSHIFNDVDSDQTVSSFAEEVKKVFNYTDSVRLIYCGKILEYEKLLSEYFKEVNNGFVVCMPEKSKQQTTMSIITPSESASVTEPISTRTPPPSRPLPMPSSMSIPVMQSTPNITNNMTYTIDEIRAILLVFSRFIKVSPELFYMFATNDASFQSLILSPTFTSQILTPLLESSNTVMQGLQNGTDIAVQIPIFGRTPTTTSQTHFTDGDDVITTDEMSSNALDMVTTELNTTELNSTAFTVQDKENIRDLCEFGFQESHVMRVYVMANRNKELAASMLYELSE